MNNKLTAILLIAAAVLTNAAFTVLGMVFNYPDVLGEPVDDILAAFRANQTAVVVWFTVMALSAALLASSWRQTGYIMLLYLAGLKGVDPSLREAAAVDGASQVRTFFSVVFPVMRPINIIVIVVTVIKSLRAFDIVWVINKGTNGLELISTLVTSNVVGEASRIGFGSALATIMLLISLVFITIFLSTVMRGERR